VVLGNKSDEDEGKGRQVRTSQSEVRVHGGIVQAEIFPFVVLGHKSMTRMTARAGRDTSQVGLQSAL
jgi:hypothetical protein